MQIVGLLGMYFDAAVAYEGVCHHTSANLISMVVTGFGMDFCFTFMSMLGKKFWYTLYGAVIHYLENNSRAKFKIVSVRKPGRKLYSGSKVNIF